MQLSNIEFDNPAWDTFARVPVFALNLASIPTPVHDVLSQFMLQNKFDLLYPEVLIQAILR